MTKFFVFTFLITTLLVSCDESPNALTNRIVGEWFKIESQGNEYHLDDTRYLKIFKDENKLFVSFNENSKLIWFSEIEDANFPIQLKNTIGEKYILRFVRSSEKIMSNAISLDQVLENEDANLGWFQKREVFDEEKNKN